MKKTCKNCGKVGLPEGKRVYCSHTCYKQWNNKQQAKNKGTNEYFSVTECLICGKSLEGESNAGNRKYCVTCRLLGEVDRTQKKSKQYTDYLSESKQRQRERPTHWIDVNDN